MDGGNGAPSHDATASGRPGTVTGGRHETSDVVQVLVDGARTQGRFSLLRIAMRPGEEPLTHIHTREDEAIYVLSGQITAHIDGETRHCAAGDCVLLPRGSEHTYRIDTEEAVLLLLLMPAGLESYYRELARLAETERGLEHMIAASARYGIEIVGPGMPREAALTGERP
jgi:quercetin dioxygenase-like cupin family protein